MVVIKQVIFLFTTGVLLAVGNYLVNPKRVAWDPAELKEGEMSLQAVLELGAVQEVIWIDARVEADFNVGHIPGAVLLNEDDWDTLFVELIDQWTGDATIVVYCGSGGCQASHKVAKRLREDLGFDDIWVLHGGWKAWEEANP